MSDQDKPGAEGDPGRDIGSVGEEAAKLLGAISEWARDQGSDLGQGLGGLAGHAATSMQDINEHIATGSAECTYCPICRGVHVIRGTSPEVKAHLVTAASSFLQAASALLATQLPKDGTGRASHVERIDLDLDLDDEGAGRGPGDQ
ncbi:MAG: hypothetical protein M3237_06015 [Actinomycetota bacterium]|nr:hypothetical protein [Actinomycetota bacterium]